jgi:hypothetical protein
MVTGDQVVKVVLKWWQSLSLSQPFFPDTPVQDCHGRAQYAVFHAMNVVDIYTYNNEALYQVQVA